MAYSVADYMRNIRLKVFNENLLSIALLKWKQEIPRPPVGGLGMTGLWRRYG